MPHEVSLKLRMMVTCEKVIIDGQTGVPSLIAIFARMKTGPSPEELPLNAALPLSWSIYTAWDRVGTDVESTFAQKTTIILPDGTNFVEQEMVFTLPANEPQARNVVTFLGFPIGQEGELIIRSEILGMEGSLHETKVKVERVLTSS